VEGENITDPQTIAETFNDYFVAIAENVKKNKEIIILLMMIMIVWIIILSSWNKLLTHLTQAWRVNTHQQKKLKEL